MHKCGITDTFFAKHLWNSKSSVNDCCFLSLLFLFSTASDYISLSRCKVYTCRNYWTQWSAWFCVRSGKECNERINHVPLFSLTHTRTHAQTASGRSFVALHTLNKSSHHAESIFAEIAILATVCFFFLHSVLFKYFQYFETSRTFFPCFCSVFSTFLWYLIFRRVSTHKIEFQHGALWTVINVLRMLGPVSQSKIVAVSAFILHGTMHGRPGRLCAAAGQMPGMPCRTSYPIPGCTGIPNQCHVTTILGIAHGNYRRTAGSNVR